MFVRSVGQGTHWMLSKKTQNLIITKQEGQELLAGLSVILDDALAKLSSPSQNILSIHLSELVSVAVSYFKGSVNIDIRRYFQSPEKGRLPTKSGVNYKVEEFCVLKEQLEDLAIRSFNQDVQGQLQLHLQKQNDHAAAVGYGDQVAPGVSDGVALGMNSGSMSGMVGTDNGETSLPELGGEIVIRQNQGNKKIGDDDDDDDENDSEGSGEGGVAGDEQGSGYSTDDIIDEETMSQPQSATHLKREKKLKMEPSTPSTRETRERYSAPIPTTGGRSGRKTAKK
jgi:hypothetical protein